MKYLDEFFVPYDSSFETNILLASIFSCFCKNSFFLFLCLQNLWSFHPFLYWVKKKCKKTFYNNLGIL